MENFFADETNAQLVSVINELCPRILEGTDFWPHILTHINSIHYPRLFAAGAVISSEALAYGYFASRAFDKAAPLINNIEALTLILISASECAAYEFFQLHPEVADHITRDMVDAIKGMSKDYFGVRTPRTYDELMGLVGRGCRSGKRSRH